MRTTWGGHRRGTAVAGGAGAIAVALFGVAPALADTIDGGFVQVGTNGSDAHGLVAVSDSGNATTDACNYSLGYPFGCAVGPGVVASGTGDASGGWAASGTGDASASGMGFWIPAVAVSGTGCATGWDPYGSNMVVVSGTGCATGTVPSFWEGYVYSVAGGDAVGHLTVSATGNADSRGSSTMWTPASGLKLPGVAVSLLGTASGSGAVAVAGGDATTSGGLVAVSATGDAHGGSLATVAPLGSGG